MTNTKECVWANLFIWKLRSCPELHSVLTSWRPVYARSSLIKIQADGTALFGSHFPSHLRRNSYRWIVLIFWITNASRPTRRTVFPGWSSCWPTTRSFDLTNLNIVPAILSVADWASVSISTSSLYHSLCHYLNTGLTADLHLEPSLSQTCLCPIPSVHVVTCLYSAIYHHIFALSFSFDSANYSYSDADGWSSTAYQHSPSQIDYSGI